MKGFMKTLTILFALVAGVALLTSGTVGCAYHRVTTVQVAQGASPTGAGTNIVTTTTTVRDRTDILDNKAVFGKHTIFGFELAPGMAGSSTSSMWPSMAFGLIRDEWVTVPKCKGTNGDEYMPKLVSHVNAKLSFTGQSAEEDFGTGVNQTVFTDTNGVVTIRTTN
jgi:hypothetical protein